MIVHATRPNRFVFLLLYKWSPGSPALPHMEKHSVSCKKTTACFRQNRLLLLMKQPAVFPSRTARTDEGIH